MSIKSFYEHHGCEMFELDDDDEGCDRVTCQRCGTGGLHWQEVVKADSTMGFALFNERNRKHVCAEPDAEGFEVVSNG